VHARLRDINLYGTSPGPDFQNFRGARESHSGDLVGLNGVAGGCSKAYPRVAPHLLPRDFVDVGQQATEALARFSRSTGRDDGWVDVVVIEDQNRAHSGILARPLLQWFILDTHSVNLRANSELSHRVHHHDTANTQPKHLPIRHAGNDVWLNGQLRTP
jgi:hypothetical protein